MNIQYDDKWIRANYKGKCDTAFVDAYNNHVGKKIKKDTLRHHILRMSDIESDWSYTDKQIDYVKAYYSMLGMKKTTDAFNNKFGTNKSFYSIHKLALRLGLSVPQDVANRNANPKIDKVGTIREELSSGYLVIKTGDSCKDWTKYQRYVYEQVHGKLPKNYVVIFLDGNNRNFALSNLMAVPRNFVVWMNTNKIRTDNVDLNKIAVRWCQLYALSKGEQWEVAPDSFLLK